MKEFIFESGQKRVLTGFMLLGALCLIAAFLFDDVPYHMRFWTNYLHNTVFFTGIALMTLFIMAASITAWAGWYTVFKRLWEAYSLFLIVGLGLMAVVILGLLFHAHHLYHWADAESVANDPILQHKSGFLNNWWYSIGTVFFVGLWYFFARTLRKLSIEEDMVGTADFQHHRKIRKYAAAFLPIAAFSSAAMIWQWIMSIDAHWYSTLFAWYTASSWFVSAMAMSILTLIYLKGKGYFQQVTEEHIHDLGKYMFAFSIFWTYLWFSQYMLIWYANVGEETVYFKQRVDEYPVLFYGNLILNFALPFLILMRNDTKRKFGTVGFVSIICLFGHWWDFFYMIKPGAMHTVHELAAHATGDTGAHEAAAHGAEAAHSAFTAGFTIPGLLELGTFLGFLALFMFFTFTQMAKARLEPANDPYLSESLHHHV